MLKNAVIKLVTLIFIGFSSACFSNQESSDSVCSYSIIVGSGRIDGRYSEFVSSWKNFETKKERGLCINNKLSEGSVNNIALLETKEIDFAIVQSDIGHHAFFGKNGYSRQDSFSGLKPLYSEFVQIVVRGENSDSIKAISSLDGKTVAAGNSGSGGYWNALDLLSAAGLQEGYNFQLYKGNEHPVIALSEDRADAAIYTSAKPHQVILDSKLGEYKYIQMPESASKTLSIGLKKFYYDHAVLKLTKELGYEEIPSLSVHSYLVVSDSISSETVELVKESIDEFIASIGERDESLRELNFIVDEIQDPPFSMHFLSVKQTQAIVFAQIVRFLKDYLLLVTISGLALFSIYAQLCFRRKNYNSIGVVNPKSALNKFQLLSFKLSKYTIGIAVCFLALIMISVVISLQEERFASARGIDSPLEGFSLIDSVIWLIKTAFTTLPTEVPLSITSSILIPVTVILGLGAFLHPAKVGYSALERKNELRVNGQDSFSWLRDHVVICGWNERTEGIILSLISQHTPQRKEVVVIADIGGDSPLIAKGFDQRRVHYVRGDASNTSTLHRAAAGYASEAIIIACDSKKNDKNIGSVLTAVALSSLAKSINRPDSSIFLCVELIYQENKQAFLNAGVDAFIHVKELTDKVAAASAVSEGVSDFVIDFLTFDDHFELYSRRVSKLPAELIKLASFDQSGDHSSDAPLRLNGTRLREVMVDRGVQLLGKYSTTKDSLRNNIDICNSIGLDEVFSGEDRIVYFSVLKKKINDTKWLVPSLQTSELPDWTDQSMPKILLIGNEERILSVSDLIKSSGTECTTVTTDEIIDHLNALKICDYINYLENYSRVVILEDLRLPETAVYQGESMAAETRTALIVKYLTTLRERNGLSFLISSEVRSHRDRELYSMSGVDDVLVRNSLVERIIAKMVFNHGRMYDVINKLLTLDDGIYLKSYIVEKGDCFDGKDIKYLFLGRHSDYQVCGWLPIRMAKYLKQNTMGIETHWVTALNSKTIKNKIISNSKVTAGDKLMILKIT